MSNRRLYALLCALSLTAGAVLYILFRQNSYVAVLCSQWFDLHTIQAHLQEGPWDLFRYYLPDLLWSFSLSCGLASILGTATKVWFGSGFFFGCLWELLQLIGIVSGTADSLDILMYLTGSLLCIFISKRRV